MTYGKQSAYTKACLDWKSGVNSCLPKLKIRRKSFANVHPASVFPTRQYLCYRIITSLLLTRGSVQYMMTTVHWPTAKEDDILFHWALYGTVINDKSKTILSV